MSLCLQAYLEMPPVTRVYTTACVITTLAVQMEVVSPFQLYFNPLLIMRQFQVWRVVTTFLFFGTFGFNFLFNMIFTYRYCRMLEEGSFRGKSADFVMMFIFGAGSMITFAFFVNLLFLGQVCVHPTAVVFSFALNLMIIRHSRSCWCMCGLVGILTFG